VAWEQKFQVTNPRIAQYPLKATVSDGRLYVLIARSNAYVVLTGLRGQIQLPEVRVYNLDDGKLAWRASIANEKASQVMLAPFVLTEKHLVTVARIQSFQGNRTRTIMDDVHMYDAATGQLVEARTETEVFNARNPSLRDVIIPPGAVARRDTLILSGIKGLTAYRK
jgi:hypothetical protein